MNTVAMNAYAKVELDTIVAAADSHKLILLLFQGALLAISQAKGHMLRKDAAAKGKSISHAIRIISEGLLCSLDKDAGGELAQNLAALYEYMGKRLLEANLKNDMAALDEVSKLLTELKEGWEAIRVAAVRPATKPETTKPEAAKPQAAPIRAAALTYGRV